MSCLNRGLPFDLYWDCIQDDFLEAVFEDFLSGSKRYSTEREVTYGSELLRASIGDIFEFHEVSAAIEKAIEEVPDVEEKPARRTILDNFLKNPGELQNLYSTMQNPDGSLEGLGQTEDKAVEELEKDICDVSKSSLFGSVNDTCGGGGGPTPSPIINVVPLFTWCAVELITGITGTAASNVTITFPNIQWLKGNLTSNLNTSVVVEGINAAITATACADNSFVCCRTNIIVTALNPIISNISIATAAAIPSAISGAADANAVVDVVESALKSSGFPFNVNTTSCYSLINLVTVFAGATISLIKDYVFGTSNGLSLVTNSFTDPIALAYVLNNSLYIGNITAGIQQGVTTSNCTDQANLCCEVGEIIKTIPSNLTAFANSILTGSSINPAIAANSSVATVFNQVNGALNSAKLVNHSISVAVCYPVDAFAFISECAIDLFKWPVSQNPEQALTLNTTYVLRGLPYVKNSLSALKASEIQSAVEHAKSRLKCSSPPKDCCTIGLMVNSTNSTALSSSLESQFSTKCSSTADVWALVGCVKGIMWSYIPTNTTDFSPCYPSITSDDVKAFIANCTGDIIRGDTDTEVSATAAYPDARAFQLKSALRSANQNITEDGFLQVVNNLQCFNSTDECCLRMSVINITLANPSGISSSLLDGGMFLNNSIFNVPNTTIEVVKFTKKFMSDHGFPARNASACNQVNECDLIETPPTYGGKLDYYICGSPGYTRTRCYNDNGQTMKIAGVVGAAGMEGAYNKVFGADAAEILKIMRFIRDTGSNADCSTSECSDGVCGTVKSGSQKLIHRCGVQIGWWNLNQLCATNDGDPLPTNKWIDCNKYSSSAYNYSSSAIDYYGCSKSNPDSCYKVGSPCCGCADWNDPTCMSNPSVAHPTIDFTCGLSTPPPFQVCANYDQTWMKAVLPFMLVRRMVYPTLYVYQFDDKESTYQCHSNIPPDAARTTHDNTQAYHIVACPGTTMNLKSITNNKNGYRVLQVQNSCNEPIWPALFGNADGSCSQVGDASCKSGTECYIKSFASDIDPNSQPTAWECHWKLYDPYKMIGGVWNQVDSNNYILNPGEYMQFRIPLPATARDDGLTWAGQVVIRTGCNNGAPAQTCETSDCRGVANDAAHRQHYLDGFKCIPTIGPTWPEIGVEFALLNHDLDTYDVQAIEPVPTALNSVTIIPERDVNPVGVTFVD